MPAHVWQRAGAGCIWLQMSMSSRLAGTRIVSRMFRQAGRALVHLRVLSNGAISDRFSAVMAGLMPAIHALLSDRPEQRSVRPVGTTGLGIAPPPSPAPPVTFDVEPEIRSVLRNVAVAGRPPGVRLQFAVEPELMLRADRAAFRHALAVLVRQAGSQALVARVLVTAARRGERVEVSVSDDRLGTDRWARLAAPHPIEQLLTRQGGTLEIMSWPEQGTSIVMHWPAAGPVVAEPESAPPVVWERTSVV